MVMSDRVLVIRCELCMKFEPATLIHHLRLLYGATPFHHISNFVKLIYYFINGSTHKLYLYTYSRPLLSTWTSNKVSHQECIRYCGESDAVIFTDRNSIELSQFVFTSMIFIEVNLFIHVTYSSAGIHNRQCGSSEG